VRQTYEEVQATRPAERMARIADEIAAARPDLVGLQEAARYATKSSLEAAEVVELDFVQLILDALRARGLGYHVVDGATSLNFDRSLPDDTVPVARQIHFTDRDVVLARDDVATRDAANGRFAQLLGVRIGIFSLQVPRGWGAVTADVNGATVRFVNTHLEAIADPTGVREAQARELATIAGASSPPTLVVGDFNSPPAEATGAYGIVTGAGFTDAWAGLHPNVAGLTCCLDPTLTDAADPLETRIDLVLYRSAFTPLSADVVGEDAGDRTASGLWPSDHAGVVAALRAP
jgi:endonuclease/exonuclease/phosphatase family metal-dependent hydrolase